MLHKHTTDVAGDPFIKDGDKKTTTLFRSHGAISYRVSFLEACFVIPLNDGYKLDKLCPYVVAEELIYFGGMRNVSSTNCAQNVKLNVVLLQQTSSVQHSVKSRVSRLVYAVGIVQFPWPVKAQADEIAMFVEKGAPLLI